jgi:hypothetical protein
MPCRCVCTRTLVACSVYSGVVYGLLFAAIAEYVRLDDQPRGTTDLRYQRTVLIAVWTCLGLALAQVFGTALVLVCTHVRKQQRLEREPVRQPSLDDSSV